LQLIQFNYRCFHAILFETDSFRSAPMPSLPSAVPPTVRLALFLLLCPFFSFPPKGKSANDLKAWDAAIERAKANLAHHMLRNTNADLQLRHASNAHKVPPLIAPTSFVAQCKAGPQFCSRGAASERAGAWSLHLPTESFVLLATLCPSSATLDFTVLAGTRRCRCRRNR
jgi:hypothetical protein